MTEVSVIIPTFNRLEVLKRAVASVVAQTYPQWELWIIDDGSSDGTDQWAQKLIKEQTDLEINYLKTVNRGVSHARNSGIERAQGEWLAFLDSDDEWMPNKLKQQIESLTNETPLKPGRPPKKKSLIVHTDEIWIRKGVRVNPHKKHKKIGGRIFSHCLPLCCISPSTVMIHKSVFKEVGLFKEDYPVCEDYDLWLRITSQYEVRFIEEPLIKKYGGHDDQLSRKFFAMDYWRVKSLSEHLDSSYISEEERSLLQNTIKRKSEILLQGYKKHNNLKNYSEINEILTRISSTSPFLS